MEYPLVTIAIPTNNRADGFLKDAVQSALDQTYPNIEIIVSDNCSSDDTRQVVQSFQDPRLRYHRHPVNIGANNNFNYCVQEAKGVYFLLLSDDDLMIDKDFIEVCMKAVDYRVEFGIIKKGTRIIDSLRNLLSEHYNRAEGTSTIDFIRSWLENKTAMYLCSRLFNTKLLKETGGVSSKNNLFQDVIAEFKAAETLERVEIVDLKASFRKHPGERTATKKIKAWCEDSHELIDVLCDLVPEEKQYILEKGAAFLANINYSFARRSSAKLERFLSYMTVFHSFKYRFLPPPVIQKFRSLKRRISCFFYSGFYA